ncbi:MAG TPA: hypothetical protein VGM21_14200 [Actinomycetota bacterium]|jgi:hypothetical protein
MLACRAVHQADTAGRGDQLGPNRLWWSVRAAAVNPRRLLVLGLAHRDGAWALA